MICEDIALQVVGNNVVMVTNFYCPYHIAHHCFDHHTLQMLKFYWTHLEQIYWTHDMELSYFIVSFLYFSFPSFPFC